MVKLAGGSLISASFSNSTVPVAASISIADLALSEGGLGISTPNLLNDSIELAAAGKSKMKKHEIIAIIKRLALFMHVWCLLIAVRSFIDVFLLIRNQLGAVLLGKVLHLECLSFLLYRGVAARIQDQSQNEG